MLALGCTEHISLDLCVLRLGFVLQHYLTDANAKDAQHHCRAEYSLAASLDRDHGIPVGQIKTPFTAQYHTGGAGATHAIPLLATSSGSSPSGSGDDQIGHQDLALGLGPEESRRGPCNAADPRANDHRLG
jgi:hypothetical protein